MTTGAGSFRSELGDVADIADFETARAFADCRSGFEFLKRLMEGK
jgi:hypothetical protein